jgi:hypothetical protein
VLTAPGRAASGRLWITSDQPEINEPKACALGSRLRVKGAGYTRQDVRTCAFAFFESSDIALLISLRA